MFETKTKKLKILLLGLLLSLSVLGLGQMSLADSGGFDGQETCQSSADWYLDTECTEDFVKSVHGETAVCKTDGDDVSVDSYFCYCVGFDEWTYDLYNCDGFLNNDDEFVSFTQFEGGLDSLKGDDYDPILTESDNARDYISKIINFALTFLGFVAVIGIIYSGALYIFAGGDTSAAEKGKEGVKLITIGLLLIIGSYAIVNTVLEATTGDEGSLGSNNSGSGQVESIDGSSAFNNETKDQVVSDLKIIEGNIGDVYAVYYKVVTPFVDLIADDLDLTDANDVSQAISILNAIKSNTDKFSETYQVADDFQAALKDYLREQQKLAECDDGYDSDCDGLPNTYEAVHSCLDSLTVDDQEDPDGDGLNNLTEYNTSKDPCKADGPVNSGGDGASSTGGGSSSGGTADPESDTTLPPRKQDDVNDPLGALLLNLKAWIAPIAYAIEPVNADYYIEKLYEAISLDYNSNMDDIIDQYASMAQVYAGLDDSNATKIAYFNIYDELGVFTSSVPAGSLYQLKVSPSDSNFKTADSALIDLTKQTTNMLFVDTVLNASTVRCQVPCTVSFDSLGTIDPSGKTVTDQQHLWDLNGDGEYNQSDVFGDGACDEHNGQGDPSSNVVCTYYESETYLVSLLVESNQPDIYAPGKAQVKIIVEAPDSRVYLTSYPQNDTESGPKVIYDFLSDVSIRNTVIEYSPEIAMGGIYFDARGSVGKSGRPVTDFAYDIQGEDYLIEDDNGQILYYFPTDANSKVVLGSYSMSLIVREGDIVDEYPFTVVIEDPSIQLKIEAGNQVGDNWHLDASGSSAVGPIQDYIWAIVSADGQPVLGEDGKPLSFDSISKVDWRPAKAGKYFVSLKINSDNGFDKASDSETIEIVVSPVRPVACFNYESKDEFSPAVVTLDAGCTENWRYDNPYYYQWILPKDLDYEFTEANEDFEHLMAAQDTNYLNNQKLQIRFQEQGDFPIELIVTTDPNLHSPPDKSIDVSVYDAKKETIEVDNLMDLDAQIYINDGGTYKPSKVASLDLSSPKVNFYIDVASQYLDENAYQLDYLNKDLLSCGSGGELNLFDEARGVDWEMNEGETPEIDYVCTYKNAGEYLIQVNAELSDGNENSILRRVYVAQDDEPLAVINTTVDTEILEPDVDGFVYGNIKTKFRFDGSYSLNSKGKKDSNMKFVWKLGDGSTYNGSDITKIYDEVLPDGQYYTVNLSVTDAESKEDDVELYVVIQEEFPAINRFDISNIKSFGNDEGLIMSPVQIDLVTDVSDIDGRIVEYTWAYLDLDNLSAGYIDSRVTTEPKTSFTINNNGNEGESHDYVFILIAKDNDGNRMATENALLGDVSCSETSFSDTSQKDCRHTEPRLEVINGPNDNPTADFTVDRTTIFVGESINFDAGASYDPDGVITEYIWDFEGNGLYDNEPIALSSTGHTFNQVANEGVKVTLRVRDNMGATDTAEPFIVYVDAFTDPPTAAFTYDTEGPYVAVTNKSSVDPDGSETAGGELDPLTIVSCVWDQDIDKDSDGDGVKDNDQDLFSEVDPTLGAISSETVSASSDPCLDDPADPACVSFLDTFYAYVRGFFTPSDAIAEVANMEACEGGVFQYPEPGTYRVQLTVKDSVGSTDSIVNTIDLEFQEVTAYLKPTKDQDYKLDETGAYHVDYLNPYLSFDVSADGGLPPYTYKLDSNTAIDSNGDGDPANDNDGVNSSLAQAKVNSESLYFDPSLGTDFRVALMVKDAAGQEHQVMQKVVVDAGELVAYVRAYETGSNISNIENKISQAPDGAYHLDVDKPSADFVVQILGGIAPYTYTLDQDISVDSNGDGIRDNDDDTSGDESPHTISFDPEFGSQFTIQLTAVDDNGQKYSTRQKIILDSGELNAYLLGYEDGASSVKDKVISASPDGSYHLESTDPNMSFYISADGGLGPYKYWIDLNADIDSDGDGDTDNDNDGEKDALTDAMTYTFEDAAFDPEENLQYRVKLIIEDSLGDRAEVTQKVTLDTGELKAYLTGYEYREDISDEFKLNTAPDGSYHLSVDDPDMTFNVLIVGGTPPYKYNLDLNTDIDSDGDGNKTNDADAKFTDSQTMSSDLSFDPSVNKEYPVRLTIKDNLGKMYTVNQKVVLDSGQLTPYLVPYNGTESSIQDAMSPNLDGSYHISIAKPFLWFQVAAMGGLAPYNFQLDTNIALDSDGDGIKNNDADYSGIINSSKDLEDYRFVEFDSGQIQNYELKLMIEDQAGEEVSVQQKINLDTEDLTVTILSNPAPEPIDNKIHLEGTSGEVLFSVTNNGGIGALKECFDFNARYDDNLDGNTRNDCASPLAGKSNQYKLNYQASWGTLQAVYRVEDELGRSAESIVNIVFNKAPVVIDPVDVFLLPASGYEDLLYQSDNRIHFTTNPGKIAFKVRAEGGELPYAFCLDKNINFDSDGNSIRNDDCNYTYTAVNNSFVTTQVMDFYQEWGSIFLQVTATDSAGVKDQSKVQIVFDLQDDLQEQIEAISANVLTALPLNLVLLLAGLTGFAILSFVVWKGKRANVLKSKVINKN